ncbi:hypothetical protein L6452_42502 [Arctium lappa]|uniref:Uncharacterized protein n=1 Tax=Arctium lappa TaxID=4217 RepID=A0ACB8XIE9_ARCLA|nr:hypothetical protein L6452_42502 [Arctium lappa]
MVFIDCWKTLIILALGYLKLRVHKHLKHLHKPFRTRMGIPSIMYTSLTKLLITRSSYHKIQMRPNYHSEGLLR